VKSKIRVGVIFGGRSGEHEVSLASARSIIDALDKDKYEIVPIGVTREGRWLTRGDPWKELVRQSSAPFLLEPGVGVETTQAPNDAAPPASPPTGTRDLIPGTREAGIPDIDVIFPALHGPYGEDGTVQGLLELADIPYVGADVLGSALGMDKIVQKTLLRAHGLPVTDFVPIRRTAWERSPEIVLQRIEAILGYPCFVKPANLGSSVGITKARDSDELREGLDQAARYDCRILAERAIEGREIEVSVLGNDDPIASVPGEVIPAREFYDYAAKYLDAGTRLIAPADLPPESAQLFRELAIAAFLALNCAGMARVDFFLERKTNKAYINELNTIPGFTRVSMYPKLWEASGLPYPRLLDRLIELALERHAAKSRCEFSYTFGESNNPAGKASQDDIR
jgi:D-alanine-D-alanine ligase